MNMITPVSTFGRVTADLELKTSQNGKSTTYVQFSIAVDKGFGEKEHPIFLQCILYGADAERIVNAKEKRAAASLLSGIWIFRNLPVEMVQKTICPGLPFMIGASHRPIGPKNRRVNPTHRMKQVLYQPKVMKMVFPLTKKLRGKRGIA